MTRDILSSIIAGQEAQRARDVHQANIDLQRAQLENEVIAQQQAQATNDLSNLAAQGDAGALMNLAAINPQRAAGIQKINQNRAVRGAQLAEAVLSAPATNRAQVYPRLLEQAAREGIDISQLPDQYSPEVGQQLQFIVSAGRDLEKQIEAQQPAAPLSAEGKLQADIRAGLVSPRAVTGETAKVREKVFKQTSDLRKEFTKNSGEFVKQKDAFDRIQASAQNPSAAGDLALIFNFMKVLDPGSTVREGEFANAQNAAGVPARIRALFNRVSEGTRLSDEQRNDFVSRSSKLFDKALTSQKRRVDQFRGIAERNNLPIEDVILDLIGSDPEKDESVRIVQQAEKGSGTQGPPPAVQEGATATNPQTGQKIVFRGGRWQQI